MELDKDCCGNVVAAEQQAQHTPGPWTAEGFTVYAGDGDDFGDVARATAGDSHVDPDYHLDRPDYERIANARLIAAAPETAAERDRLREVNADLLEAAKDAEAVLMGIRDNGGELAIAILPALVSVRAAIAKAEVQ